MSKNTKIILLVLVVLLVLIGLSYWSGKQMSKFSMPTGSSTIITDGTWLRLNPSAMVADYTEIMPMNYFGSSQSSVEALTRKIRNAATDKRIAGIFIEPSFVQLSLPSLWEIGLALEEFKASGKPVKGFGDFISQADYMLMCYADEIYMEPSASAGLMLSGTSANIQFYKELLDKLGVKMHVIQAGEFKGAGEPYNQTQLSEGTRANIAAALSDRFDLIIEHISKARKLNPDEVKSIFNDRKDFFLSATAAQEMLLIDFPLSRQETLAKLEIKDDKLVSINDYGTKNEFPKGDKIAVVYLSGNITPGSGSFNQGIISHSKVKKIAKQIQEDKSVKAVVLRINSPGGSALESELIYQELLKLRESVPIVISMGGVAASGGYYISCGGNYVMADEGTITGSIGVIMLLPETTNLGKKVGIRSQTIKYGKYAGTFNMFEPYSPDVLASLKRNSEGTYEEFKARVMTARDISFEKINSIAEGRIYSAEDALEVNLIDEIGSLDKAIAKAAELGSISSYTLQNFPRKISFFEALKDSDFMKLSLLSLLRRNIFSPEDLANQFLEQIKPYEWHYLMPYTVD